MNIYLDIFLTFARVGGLTFGGGYAMLPILQREVVDKRKWISEADVMDFYAISQCMPGIIAVNTSLFVGNKIKGARGSVAAALGVVFPSLVIIILIASFISNFAHLPLVQNAFAGIRVCVFVLIINAIMKLGKAALIDLVSGIICLTICMLAIFTDLSPIILVVAAGLAGVITKGVKEVKGA
ncbi:MAG: chromate transporter [Christensenellales bacterium]